MHTSTRARLTWCWRLCPRMANLMVVAPDHRHLAGLRDGLEDFVRLAGTPDEILHQKTLLRQRPNLGLLKLSYMHTSYRLYSQGRSLPHASRSNSPGPGTNHHIPSTFSTTETRTSIMTINTQPAGWRHGAMTQIQASAPQPLHTAHTPAAPPVCSLVRMHCTRACTHTKAPAAS
jgi:hypothetical protein